MQAGCRRFDPDRLHQDFAIFENRICASKKEVEVGKCVVVGRRFRLTTEPRWTLVFSKRRIEEQGREMTKLQRAHDGCLGDRRRRRTWVAAKSVGEPLTRL